MAYKLTRHEMINTIDIEKCHNGRYGAPGEKRIEKVKATPEEIKKQNEWKAERDLKRKINANFFGGDYHMIWNWTDKDRPDIEGANKQFDKMITLIRNTYKELGQTLKWVSTLEKGKKAIHIHVIINNIVVDKLTTVDIVRTLWKKFSSARVTFIPLDDNGEYKKLANYFVKEFNRNFTREENVNKCRYRCSRNLKEAKQKVEIVESAKTFSKTPRAPKGWYIDKESFVEGKNVAGHKYQYYTLIRLNPITREERELMFDFSKTKKEKYYKKVDKQLKELNTEIEIDRARFTVAGETKVYVYIKPICKKGNSKEISRFKKLGNTQEEKQLSIASINSKQNFEFFKGYFVLELAEEDRRE